MKKILVIVIVLILVALGIFFATQSSPKSSAEKVMSLFNKGQYEQVYKESLMSKRMSFSQFSGSMGIGFKRDITKAKKVSWKATGEQDSQPYIYGDFKYPDGEIEDLTFWFIKRKGDYLLFDITPETPKNQ